ncbi:gamma-interferon-inducible lysosomal thiol reductase-like isoform X2 [Prorops nasuta]|uniref:gamma-interferon-inducible lysosomal thiol reductase-like isoform X2 n=1 Tax=Prorops nasuta TaxID=863751 RepID=UPI0034CEF3A2
MGIGSLRYKIIIALGITFILWQLTRHFFVISQLDSGEREASEILLSSKTKEKQKIHVTVYYEALCSDSRGFILKQLVPTFLKIEEYLQVELIPYGKAETRNIDGRYEFECQHGPLECEANIIHSCAIDSIKDPSLLINYISCMIKNNVKPLNIMEACAENLYIDRDPIWKCYEGPKGRELLAEYGRMTKDLNPPVTFIPTILINGNADNQSRILKSLLKEVCLQLKVIPEGCK